ncbi:helicase-associated domain-containing protein [Tautonia rosea]|uniref:helicase-associated domain-containing protein n=1 Tax=Tautonia rosea TaxID=2728037 RepID=UPI0014744632|nr:helicase-associated domain-containing protein [Tautonia rosea]
MPLALCVEMTDPTLDDDGFDTDDRGEPSPPCSYRAALAGAAPFRLRLILRELGRDPGRRTTGLAEELADRLEEPGVVAGLISDLSPVERQGLGLFALTETAAWPAVGFGETLRGLGLDQQQAIERPMALGLIAPMPPATDPEVPLWPLDPDRVGGTRLVVHPAVLESARITEPEGEGPPVLDEPARLVRESDGLEAVLRLAALWQLADTSPLKRTRQGGLYKRDRQRLDEDPALAGPIADVLHPLDDHVSVWLSLARSIGLLIDEPESDRIVAAPASIWAEHGVHLPQMIAARWLGGVDLTDGGDDPGSTLALRPVSLLWLASLKEEAWVSLDDLATWLSVRMRAPTLPALSGKAERRRGRSADETPSGDPMTDVLRSTLLGPAYLLGLVRVGEAGPSRAPAMQLTERGRYVLGLGPPPPPPPRIEQFLFVQPNFEIVAYRQGLNPALIGRLSRFARWSQLGSALTLRLNSDAIDRGLASGLSVDQIRDWLTRHGVRPLPDGVAGAIASWAGRRDRLTYYASATLIEFSSAEELENALAEWAEGTAPPPVRVADRVLLVEDEGAIPFRRFQLAGARDYRKPPESCVEVGPDGITLSADPARGDLFIEAELSRFADPVPNDSAETTLRRRYVVSPASLRRGSHEGMTLTGLAQWYTYRTGAPMPPVVRWLASIVRFEGAQAADAVRAGRPLIVRTERSEVLDGLLQHPDTRTLFGDRLGPTAAIVKSGDPERLQKALTMLGVSLLLE